MTAQLKIYTNSNHTSEVAHTTANSTTLNGAVTSGSSSITLTSTSGFPSQGFIDIIDPTNGNETLPYSSVSGNTLTMAIAPTVNHSNGLTVNQWYYSLAVGDQTNGILNDGSQSTPTVSNTNTWYLYNSGDQTAQNITMATSSSSPSTSSGFTDTLLSITSASSGFSNSVSPNNINAGSQVQFWVVAEIPANQSTINNPQICLVNVNYQSI